MITLIAGGTKNGHYYPYVKTPDEEISIMYRNGEFGAGDIPPSHVTVKDSKVFGHKINFQETEDGGQILTVTDVCDDDWKKFHS